MIRLPAFLARLLRTGPWRPDDSGIFDPYIPLGLVKEVSNDILEEPITDKADLEGFSRQRASFWLFQLLIIGFGLVLGWRLVTLQINRGEENYSLAEGNRLKVSPIPAPRGLIYDRTGLALVHNNPSFSVIFHLANFPRKAEEQDQLTTKIATILNLEAKNVSKIIKDHRRDETVLLAEGISRDQALSYEIKFSEMSGVELIKTPVRQYSDLPSLGHIIGYTGKVNADELKQYPDLLPTSSIGKAGLEKTYDQHLQGKIGAETLEVDSAGRTVRSVGSRQPLVGHSLILGLDASLQRQTAQSLRDSLEKNHAQSGAAVMVDVRSGDVLSMVSVPDFDSNLFTPGGNQEQRQQVLSDPSSPLINRVIAGQYPSGSTVKPVVATAGLQEKVIAPSTKLDTSEGKIVVGQTTFNDWKVHGITEVTQAIAESNNIFFMATGGGYKQISGLGVNRLTDYYQRFGLGNSTGIDIPGEAKGLVPGPDWKKKVKKESWFIGDTYNLSIGQGDLLVTPLQLVGATGAIANNGTLLKPRLVKTILQSNGTPQEELKPVAIRENVAQSEWLAVVRHGMRRAVESGSARSFATLPVQVAAKTGTAQFNVAKDRTHSWFVAFAPYENPEVALAVIVEGGGEGFAVAAPVAKNMLEKHFNLPLTPIAAANPDEEH